MTEPAQHLSSDHRLPGLTARQSQRVRDHAREVLAERGFEAVVHAEHLRLANGLEIGLRTLGSVCHQHPEARWRETVARWLDDALGTYPEPPPPLTPAQLRDGVHLRLAPLGLMGRDWSNHLSYARSIGAGFFEVLAHKDGDYVRWVNDAEAAAVGVEELRSLGRRRLLEIRPDECELVSGHGTEVHVLRGESGFIASKLLVLRDTLRVFGGPRMRYPDGVLVAVPNRHTLAFAPVDATYVETIAGLFALAGFDYAHGHAPLTPEVYWWQDDRIHQIFDPTAVEPTLHPDLPAAFLDFYDRFRTDRGAA
ncbi:MAG TPA: hypothetical protein VMZ00_10115 [Sporichthya sp.]|nr:hypothetical protein [Sporichthya sp.]